MLDVKLKNLDAEVNHRRTIAKMYLEGIKNPELSLPLSEVDASQYDQHVWHLFVIRSKKREALQQYLAENGVQTLIHYPIPPHKQQAYKEWNDLSYPISEKIHDEVMSLPIGPTLSLESAQQIIDLCNEFRS